MSALCDIDTMVLTELHWDHEPACERPPHKDGGSNHDDGPAAWYRVALQSPCCHHPIPGMYVCDTWARAAKSGQLTLHCGRCNLHWPAHAVRAQHFTPINTSKENRHG